MDELENVYKLNRYFYMHNQKYLTIENIVLYLNVRKMLLLIM